MADGYSLKELVQELRSEQKDQIKQIERILSTLQNIDKHLEQLNSKVVTQERRLNGFSTFQTKVMMVWGFFTFVIVTAVNKFI